MRYLTGNEHLVSLLVVLAMLGTSEFAYAQSATFTNKTGRVTMTYDKAVWEVRDLEDTSSGTLVMDCVSETCGGEESYCHLDDPTPIKNIAWWRREKSSDFLHKLSISSAKVVKADQVVDLAKVIDSAGRHSVITSSQGMTDGLLMFNSYLWIEHGEVFLGLICSGIAEKADVVRHSTEAIGAQTQFAKDPLK